MNNKLSHSFNIQLFAGKDEAQGITGDDKALAAGERTTGEKTTPAAGEDTQAQRMERFEALIKGEYKDVYKAHVQHIVKQRLKGSEETIRKYKALSPVLQLLEKKYGVPAEDAAALYAALDNERSSAQRKTDALAREQYDSWLSQAGKLRETYPDFDIKAELSNHRFKELLKSGVPVGDAYELIHRAELMEKAAGEMEERISRRILSGTARPRESALRSQSSAMMKSDVSQMSKKARQDIIRRVQQGEKISF